MSDKRARKRRLGRDGGEEAPHGSAAAAVAQPVDAAERELQKRKAAKAAKKEKKRRRKDKEGGAGGGGQAAAGAREGGGGDGERSAAIGAPSGAAPAAAGGAGGGDPVRPTDRSSTRNLPAHTVSIALPGSIIDNAQSQELQAYVAGQIARAAAVFCVDEIVVFDDGIKHTGGNARAPREGWDPCVFLARVLQYLETPQYLRKPLIPRHPDLRFAGLLNPLDTPHHMRIDDDTPFREGVVLNRPTKAGSGSFVNAGMRQEVQIDKTLTPGVRVTVELDKEATTKKVVRGKAVPPSKPRAAGHYWGYSVRIAGSIGEVFARCPYEGGYDLTIGTSERGTSSVDDPSFALPPFKHALVVFGGVVGLEESIQADDSITLAGDDAALLFDLFANTCPAQGSGTIRTEEAIPITLSVLLPHMLRNSPPK